MYYHKNASELEHSKTGRGGGFCLFYFSKKLLSSFSSAGAVGIRTIVLGHLKGAFSPVSSVEQKSVSKV